MNVVFDNGQIKQADSVIAIMNDRGPSYREHSDREGRIIACGLNAALAISPTLPAPKAQGWKMRVWWIPQVPMKPFLYEVPDLVTGYHLLKALAGYDIFQLKNRIKPDFANAGGMSFNHPKITDGEWWDADPTDENSLEEIADFFNETA